MFKPLPKRKEIHFADFFCGDGERLDEMAERFPRYKYLGVDKKRPDSLHPKVEFTQKDLSKPKALLELGRAYRIRVLNMDMPVPELLTQDFFKRIRTHLNLDVLVLTTGRKDAAESLRAAGFHVSDEGYHELISSEREATPWTRVCRMIRVKTYLASPLRV